MKRKIFDGKGKLTLSRKQKIAAGALAAVLVAFAVGKTLFGGGGAGGPGGPGGPGGMAMGEDSVPTVSVVKPEIGSISLSTSLTGQVEPADVVYVYAKAGGDVTGVLVKAGDRVEAGQVLLQIDTDQVDTAKNSMESAQIAYAQAQDNLSRQQILYASGGLSEQAYQQYVNQARSAELSYQAAKMAYDKQVEYSTITAPIAGVVESCDVEVHDSVAQSSQLCVISGEGSKRLSFQVTEKVKENLEAGDPVEIRKNGKTYQGTITEVSTMTDSSTGLYKAKAEFDGADSLSTGSVVKLSVVSDRADNAMTIPVDAIYFTGSENYVFVYEDGAVHKAVLEVGLYNSELAQVISGLDWDDQVISTWSSDLYENAKAKLSGGDETGGASPSDAAAGGGAILPPDGGSAPAAPDAAGAQ